MKRSVLALAIFLCLAGTAQADHGQCSFNKDKVFDQSGRVATTGPGAYCLKERGGKGEKSEAHEHKDGAKDSADSGCCMRK